MKNRKVRYNLARSRQVAVIRDKAPREMRRTDGSASISKPENDRALAAAITGQFDDCWDED